MGSLDELRNSLVGDAVTGGEGGTWVAGKFGQALFFPKDGTRSASAKIPAGVFSFRKCTVEFHVKRGSSASGYLFGALLVSSESDEAFQLQFREGYDGQYRTFVYLKKNTVECYYQINHGTIDESLVFLPRDTWVHIGLSIDTTASPGSKIRMFRNGVDVGLIPFSAGSDGTLDDGLNQYPIYIMSHFSADGTGFNGAVDNIKIYSSYRDNFMFDAE